MPVNELTIDSNRLLARIQELGQIGSTKTNGVARLALTDEDKAGRDLVISWMVQAQLDVSVDEIGNIFGVRRGEQDIAPVMSGSHLDTVYDGGKLDGAYGVLGALEVVQTLRDLNVQTRRPLAVAIFTNEEGVRFQPDMMGSLAYAGGLSVKSVLGSRDRAGVSIKSELVRIGYAGSMRCGALRPNAFVELHIEQGPVLDRGGEIIGAVENLQGISWTELEITGQANHAGTTPMHLRHDAGYCVGAITTFLRSLSQELGASQVATVGAVELQPNVINVIPGYARMTIDLRNTDNDALTYAEQRLDTFVENLRSEEGVEISTRRLARFEPVEFNQTVVEAIERQALRLSLPCRRMTSGAGHDAQMMSRTCATAMIFVPSTKGVSHSPHEHTEDEHLAAGANVLLHTLLELANTV